MLTGGNIFRDAIACLAFLAFCAGNVAISIGANAPEAQTAQTDFKHSKWKNYLSPTRLRDLGKEYKNDTDHAIEVSVQTYGLSSCAVDLWIDGEKIASQYFHGTSGGQSCSVSAIVPADSKYCANRDDGKCTDASNIIDITLNGWYELR